MSYTKYQFLAETKIFIFWTKLTQKGYFQSKADAIDTTIESCLFELV